MSRIDDLIQAHCPNGVAYKALGEVGNFTRGNGLQKKDLREEGIGAIHYGQVFTHYGTSATATKSFVEPAFAEKLRRASSGDLVIATTSENDEDVCKAVAWLGREEVVVSGDAYIFRHSLSPKYVAYFFQSQEFQVQKTRFISGTKVRRVSGKNLEKIRIPIPPLEVQDEIVRILDTFSALEAELEAELEARRTQYEYYRGKLLSHDQDRDIILAPLENVVTFINGKPHEKLVDPSGDMPLMTSRFISTQGNSARYIRSRDVLTPALVDDVALVMSDLPNGRALARAFYVDESDKYATNQRVCLLRVNDSNVLDPRYLFYVVDRNRQLLRYDNGFDQTHLKKGQILSVKIPLPPIKIQKEVAATLDRFDALVNDISIGLPAEIEARRKQYEYYRDRLLSFEEASA